jgi:hypothetical protein
MEKETGCISTCISLHLAIASQANAKDISGTTYNTFGYDNTASTPGIMAMPTGITQMPATMVIFIR